MKVLKLEVFYENLLEKDKFENEKSFIKICLKICHEIYSSKIFETNRDSLRSVLSALSGRMPTLKSVVAFWQSEVENLQAQDQVIDDNDLNLEINFYQL